MVRLFAWLLVLGAVGCFSYVGYHALNAPTPVDLSGISVHFDEASLGTVYAGTPREVFVVVKNPTNVPITIIGYPSICTANGCLKSPDDARLQIEPHSERQVPLEMIARQAGPVAIDYELYFEADGKMIARDFHVACIAVAR